MAREILREQSDKSPKPVTRRDVIRFIPFLGAVMGTAGLMAGVENLKQVDIWKHPLPPPDPEANKFLLLADIHGGDFDNGPRQNNSQSFNTLRSVVKHLKNYPFDRAFQMGDLIRRESIESRNIAHFEEGLQILNDLPFPVSQMVGNHDWWAMSEENISKISKKYNLDNFYGVQKYKDFQVVWLDMTAEKNKPGTLPPERIDWLKNNIIFKDTPTIIFSHYSLLPEDTDGNFYFEGNKNLTTLKNGASVWESLKGPPIHAVISGHMHWTNYHQVGGTHFVTVPSFVENMLSSDSNEVPGAYSILEVNFPKKFVLKSYFGSICFSRIQLSLEA